MIPIFQQYLDLYSLLYLLSDYVYFIFFLMLRFITELH